MLVLVLVLILILILQGLRSNFEMGGGTVKDSIFGGCTRRFFLLTLYNFKNNWGGYVPPRPPAPLSLFLIRKGEPGLSCLRQTKCFEKHRLTNFKPGAKEIRGFFPTSDEQCKFVF